MRVLGDIGDKDTENKVLLLEHDIPHARFSDDVMACLPQASWTITEEVGGMCWRNRTDERLGGLAAQVRWLGLRVGSRLALLCIHQMN